MGEELSFIEHWVEFRMKEGAPCGEGGPTKCERKKDKCGINGFHLSNNSIQLQV
jgi:hypothetical protein